MSRLLIQLFRSGKYAKRFLPAMILLLALGFLREQAVAQGNLLVTPRRVVFDGPGRVRELNLANIGQDTARFLVSLMEIRMKEDGSFEQITVPDSGQLFASGHLRLYPRSVSIAPGASQMVKVQLTKADELTAGEYRSHIYIRAVPVQKPLTEADTAQDTTQISVKLTAIFGISIPAIVRVGEHDARISLSEPAMIMTEAKEPHLSITLNRDGKMSSYGELTIEHVAANGNVKQVGIVKGIAVYTPNRRRRFQMDLDHVPGVDYRSGSLRIVYKAEKEAAGAPETTEAVLALH